MNVLKLIQELATIWDGKKVNTGAVVMLLALGLQNIGMEHTAALNTASGLMMGTGAVITSVGLLHKWWKARQVKKEVKK